MPTFFSFQASSLLPHTLLITLRTTRQNWAMSQPSPPVSPIEYSALPNTRERDPNAQHIALGQAGEQNNRESDPTVNSVSTVSPPSTPSPPPGYSAVSSVDDTESSIEQPRPGGTEEPENQSTSKQATPQTAGKLQSQKLSRFARYKLSFIWWLELGCCLLVVGGFVGITTTVSSLDGKPLPQWPYRLSINTFIAAFSVLMKASSGLVLAEGISHVKWTSLRTRSLHDFKMHDEASRGPWGAANLLRKDVRSVASLGAFITILVLFLEPFSQQLIAFVDCEQPDLDRVGEIPRTNIYRSEGKFSMGGSTNMPWGLSNAVNEGIYSTNKPQVRFTCDSGNCECLSSPYRDDMSHGLLQLDFALP